MIAITNPQLKRLNTVYGQWASRELYPKDRTARLAEYGRRLGRASLASSSDLSSADAKALIDSFQAELGIAETVPSRRRTRKDGEKAGTEGRRDQIHEETTLAGPSEARRLHRDMTALDWNDAHLDAFLRGKTSPLNGLLKPTTLGHYNKLHWAMKRLAAKAGRS